jgi:hypothetical protein
VNTSSQIPRAKPSNCDAIIDKIDFLLEVQYISTGVDQIEPLLDDLLNRILQSSECWPAVRMRMEQLLGSIDSDSVEILQFCMHTLRWESIREQTIRLMTEEVGVTKYRLYERVLESFHDDWPERELYARYE